MSIDRRHAAFNWVIIALLLITIGAETWRWMHPVTQPRIVIDCPGKVTIVHLPGATEYVCR